VSQGAAARGARAARTGRGPTERAGPAGGGSGHAGARLGGDFAVCKILACPNDRSGRQKRYPRQRSDRAVRAGQHTN